MIYQPLRLIDEPYVAFRYTDNFPEHRHPSIELFYCIKGSYNILIDRKPYLMHEGDLAVIGSMVSHEIPDTNSEFDSSCMVIEAGSVMLGNIFNIMTKTTFPDPIFKLKGNHPELYNMMKQTNYYRESRTTTSTLRIKGNVYNIFAYILENFKGNNLSPSKEVMSIITIENALDHIYNNYAQKITVESVAQMCGYSKTNFCRIFKNITGETFHNVLNNHRIKMACVLLSDSELSVENIAAQVGFGDSKSFCRTFKRSIGVSPGAYRKDKNS